MVVMLTVQQGGECRVLISSRLDHERSDRQEVRDVGDAGPLLIVGGVSVVGEGEGG